MIIEPNQTDINGYSLFFVQSWAVYSLIEAGSYVPVNGAIRTQVGRSATSAMGRVRAVNGG